MAQYFTDFSEYTTNADPPSDWTRRWAQSGDTWEVREGAGHTGGKYLFHQKTSLGGARNALSWDLIDSDANRVDTEIVFRWRSGGSGTSRMNGFQRASGTSSETGYTHGWAYGTYSGVHLAKYDGGDFIRFGQEARDSYDADTWMITRARVNGTSHKVRHWLASDPEPETWDIEETDSSITDAGWTGLMQFSNLPQYEVDWYGVGTGGDPAPTSEPSGGGDEVEIDPGNTGHGHSAGLPELAQVHGLGVTGTVHDHTAGGVTITSLGSIGIHLANHGHQAGAAMFGQIHMFALDIARSAHGATAAALFSAGSLASAQAIHGHGALAAPLWTGTGGTPPPGLRLIRAGLGNRRIQPGAEQRIRQII